MHRPGIVRSFCLSALLASGASLFAQDLPLELPPAPGLVDESASQFTAHRLKRIYETAEGMLARGDAAGGLSLLQTILDHPEDAFYQVDPDNPHLEISLKRHTLTRLGRLTPVERQTYELLYGVKCRELAESEQGSELLRLEEVWRRYFQTERGHDAALQLAALYFDRSKYAEAADVFEDLLSDSRLSRAARGRVLFQAALACRRSGANSRALELLNDLKAASGPGPLRLGNQTYPLFDDESRAIAWLERLAGTLDSPRQGRSWTMFRGDARRNLSAGPALPVREEKWDFRTVPLVEADDPRQLEIVESELNSMYDKLGRHDYLLFPATSPIVVDGRIIFRSMGNLKAIDAETGRFLWESFRVDTNFQTLLEDIHENLSTKTTRITPLRRFMMQRAWKDLTSGTISTDGRFVYAIEEQGVVRRRALRGQRMNDGGQDYNHLTAFAIESGKIVWELGGRREDPRLPLAGAVFLGPPLVLDRDLYCLIERDDEVHLTCFTNRELEDGRVVPEARWSQPLPLKAVTEDSGTSDFRRLAGLSPAFSSGVLVCPTGQGSVVAFNLSRRLFQWRFRYELPASTSRNVRNMLDQIENEHGITPDDQDRWVDSVPLVADGRVLMTPNDSASMYCLDLATGQLLWQAPRGRDRTIACIRDGAVVLLGQNELHARSLASGEDLWSVSINEPSGRGAYVGEHYYVPLTSREIGVVDLKTGRMLGRIPSDNDRLAGNLVAGEGMLVSQSHDRIFRYRTLEELQPELEESEPSSRTLALRAEVRLLTDGPEETLAALHEAYRADPQPRTQSLFAQSLLHALRTDFLSAERYLPELVDLTRGTAAAAEFRQLQIGGLIEHQRREEAFLTLLELVEQPATFIESNRNRVRSDRWAQSRVLDLFRDANPEQRAALERLGRERWNAFDDAGRADPRRIGFFETLPGMESLRLLRATEFDPYLESLRLEAALRRVYESSRGPEAANALAAHIRLLMKLDRVEQADVLLERLLAEFPDASLADGSSPRQLSDWALENEKLASYHARRGHAWPRAAISIDGPASSTTMVSTELPVPVGQHDEQFRHWSFYFNAQNGRLTLYDSFGELRGQWTLTALIGRSHELQYSRELLLRGNLAVLRFADHFFVIDLLNGGREPALLHGPHTLSEPFPDVGDNQRLRLQTETGYLPNGTIEIRTFDPLHRPFGDVAILGSDLIVYQRDQSIIGIDAFSGDELWRRRIGGYGHALSGSRDYLLAVSVDEASAQIFRALDGSPLKSVALPGLKTILAQPGHHLIAHIENETGRFVKRLDPVNGEEVWSIRCGANKLLFQDVETRLLVICEQGHRVRVIDIASGSVITDETLASAQPLVSFWAVPLRDGCLIALREIPRDKAEFSVTSMMYYFPPAHGPLLKLDHAGKVAWSREIANQAFNPWQAADSPTFLFLSRRNYQDPMRTRSRQATLWEIVDLATGETLSPRNDNERQAMEESGALLSDLTPIVRPDASEVEYVGSRWSLRVRFGSKK